LDSILCNMDSNNFSMTDAIWCSINGFVFADTLAPIEFDSVGMDARLLPVAFLMGMTMVLSVSMYFLRQ
jgi:hypothetical protein